MSCFLFKQVLAWNLSQIFNIIMDNPFSEQQKVFEYNRSVKRTDIILRLKDVVTKILSYFNQNSLDVPPGEPHTSNGNLWKSPKYKRGKAIRDFNKRFKGELGFQKNDIITIISQQDQYCWNGRLNDKTGWFPAKFVQVLDERTKTYNPRGDDSISMTIFKLIRKDFFAAIFEVLEDGIKHSMATKTHPWYFIQEISFRKVEDNFDSVYSRLVLCNSFNLEETEKILSAEALLCRSVYAIDQRKTLNLDVKLVCLICCGLNEQVLHLWMKIFSSSNEIVKRWYHPWALLRTTYWTNTVNCLTMLSQLPFHLNTNPERSEEFENSVIKDGLKDIVSNHYLFSWDV